MLCMTTHHYQVGSDWIGCIRPVFKLANSAHFESRAVCSLSNYCQAHSWPCADAAADFKAFHALSSGGEHVAYYIWHLVTYQAHDGLLPGCLLAVCATSRWACQASWAAPVVRARHMLRRLVGHCHTTTWRIQKGQRQA